MSILAINHQLWEFINTGAIQRETGGSPDTTQGFPTQWRAFGPVSSDMVKTSQNAYDTSGGGNRAEPLVNAAVEQLTNVPDQLKIGDQMFAGKDLQLTDQSLDFGALYGGHDDVLGKQAYAITEFEVDKPTQVILGAGSDYWMQWWIDGVEVLSTLNSGNMLYPPDIDNHCVRHTFAPGKHVIVVRSISGMSSWCVRAGFVTAEQELNGTRQVDRWEILSDGNLMLSPKGLTEPSMAIRTDLCVVDETIECDFELHSPEGQFGIVFGAQDASHYYWAYHPRWGQNWRARAFYAVIAKVDGNGLATGLGMMLMPNVVSHWNAKLSMKVERRGDQIQMYVNGVKGPFVIDDSYGPGCVGVKGHANFEVWNFKAEGKKIESSPWRDGIQPKPIWFNPETNPADSGIIRQPFALLKLADGQILAGINSRDGGFGRGNYHDISQDLVQFYLSADAGRTWQPHGEATSVKHMAQNLPACIRWHETQPGILRGFHHGPGVMGEQAKGMGCPDFTKANDRIGWALEDYTPEQLLTYRDSTDNGLTWSEPKPSRLVGDWSELYRESCWNHVYGYTQLRDGTLLAVFLHGYIGRDDIIGNKLTKRESIGEGTWGTILAQPYVSRSEDGGLTWQAPIPMDNAALIDGTEPDSPNGGWSETVLAELPSGRIVALCRPFRSPYCWQTHSDDGGRTWRQDCYASFSTAGGPAMVATQSGYLAVVGRQTGLGLHTSVDGGVNWDAGTLLDHDCWFNGFLIEAEPDVVLVFYYSPDRDVNLPPNPRMQRIRITPDGPQPA